MPQNKKAPRDRGFFMPPQRLLMEQRDDPARFSLA